MNIAILGTRGIPNNYGGFEQFAENLSEELSKKGHKVTVYNPEYHYYKETKFKDVTIVRKGNPESKFGNAANFIYDFSCLKDALKNNFDIILECGYGSVAFSYLLLDINKSTIITNMDGMEWQRTKWNLLAKKILKISERIAVRKSHYLVSDNTCIQGYYKAKYQRDSFYIPYGANIIEKIDDTVLAKYNLEEDEYFLLISRLEPENNIEIILNGIIKSGTKQKVIVVSNPAAKYGRRLRKKYLNNTNIIFVGSIYNQIELDTLRLNCKVYFHGHSIGGTNPSLLEAMASKAFIVSHDNIFNRSVLKDNAIYFKSTENIKTIIDDFDNLKQNKESFINKNIQSIKDNYSWTKIANQYEELFLKLIAKK